MSKKYTKLPRGMTWDDVNKKIRKQAFLDNLKHPKKKHYYDTVELTHDGTDFTIKGTGTDFWVEHG